MLTVKGSFNSWGISDALDADDASAPAIIDLADTTFVEPCGLVTIAALADRAVRAGRAVRFIAPNSFNVRNYLSRMRLGVVLNDLGIEHDLPTVNENDLQTELLELRRFSSQFDGEQLAQLVYDKVAGNGGLNTDAQVPEVLHTSLCELAANVTTHAQVEHGYAAAQTFNNNGSQQIVFAVADGGRGVKAGLSEAHNPKDDAEALQLAIEEGVSGTGEAGRGTGLPDVLASTVGLNGSFVLISGNAKLIQTNNNGLVTVQPFMSVYPGTLIQAGLTCRP